MLMPADTLFMLLTHSEDNTGQAGCTTFVIVIIRKKWLQLLSLRRLVRAIHTEKVFDGH
jgi:hypothetical protein